MKWIATLALLLLAAPAFAQQSQKLTLAQALDRAEKQNLDLIAARARRAVALAGVKIAGQRPNPIASVSVLRDSPHESLFFDQPVEIGSKRRRRIELAQQEGGLTEADISALERQVRRSVREAFYGLGFARGVTSEHAEILKLAERLQQIAKSRFDAGDIPEIEVTQTDLEVSRARADLQVAQVEEKVALSELNAVLNEPATTPWDLEGGLEELPQLSLDDLIARAESSNSEMKRVAQETQVEQSRLALARAERIPNVDLQFGADFNAPHDFRVGPRGQLSMELPIFMRRQGEIAQSQANQRALELETTALRRTVAGRVEAAYFEVAARQTQLTLYRQTLLPTSRKLEEMMEESYRAGKAGILTVLSAQRDVQQAERDYLDSLLAAQKAFAGLEETVGAPLD